MPRHQILESSRIVRISNRMPLVQRSDSKHVGIIEAKIEHVDIFLHSNRTGGFHQRHNTLLKDEPDHDLRWRLRVLTGDSDYDRLRHHLLISSS